MTLRADTEQRWTLLAETAQAAAKPGQPEPLFQRIDAALGQVIGHRLFTIMVVHQSTGEAERLYSNQPQAYPVQGRKQLQSTPWFEQVVVGKQHYLGNTREDIRWAFGDYQLIEQLGCGAVVNLLVIYDDSLLGSVNLLHEEGYFCAEDIAHGLPFAQLLIPALQASQAR